MTTTFLLIRHAAHSLLGVRMAGRMAGVNLNETGQAQANALALRLTGVPLSAIYSSPLERAVQTATPAAAHLGLPVRISTAITELDYGDWTGRTFEELDAMPGWRPYNAFRSGSRIPGGEMMLNAQARTVSFMQELCHIHPGGHVALVSHADIIKGALAYYLGVPLDLFLRIEISPASVSVIALDEYGPHILRVNDTGALEDGGE